MSRGAQERDHGQMGVKGHASARAGRWRGRVRTPDQPLSSPEAARTVEDVHDDGGSSSSSVLRRRREAGIELDSGRADGHEGGLEAHPARLRGGAILSFA